MVLDSPGSPLHPADLPYGPLDLGQARLGEVHDALVVLHQLLEVGLVFLVGIGGLGLAVREFIRGAMGKLDRQTCLSAPARPRQRQQPDVRARKCPVEMLDLLPAADEITVYELLAPSTHSFDIIYDVTATREGAAYFFNPIRKASTASKMFVAVRWSA